MPDSDGSAGSQASDLVTHKQNKRLKLQLCVYAVLPAKRVHFQNFYFFDFTLYSVDVKTSFFAYKSIKVLLWRGFLKT